MSVLEVVARLLFNCFTKGLVRQCGLLYGELPSYFFGFC